MKALQLVLSCFFILLFLSCSKQKEQTKPNFIIIYTDDQGYEDLGCYGSPKIKTPHIDKMAQEGVRFTDFYVASSVCSASRASLLTGRLPGRNGVGGVFFPEHKGMDTSEVTIAEMLKTVGYQTACYGKWHLGDKPVGLPTNQGFDEYFGIPYSNDMYIGPTQQFAKNCTFLDGYTLDSAKADQAFIQQHINNRSKIREHGIKELCPLFEGDKIVEYPCNQATLTKRYFQRAIDFIKKANGEPFFLYITPAMPHVPLFASEQFDGTSERGLYGDVIEEIDWNVGQLLSFLKENGLDKNTMVVYSSDNGPWLGYKDEAGSAGPLRDGKFSNYDGGVRVPCVMWWPESIEPGTINKSMASTLDMLPTLAHLSGAQIPNKPMDGVNIATQLLSNNTGADNANMYFSKNHEVWGVRKGDWKYLRHGGLRFSNDTMPPELYNLANDISEQQNLADSLPEKVQELESIITALNQDMKK